MKEIEPEIENEDGWTDWIHPIPHSEAEGYLLQCCDCGLIHVMDFSLDNLNQLVFRAKRYEV